MTRRYRTLLGILLGLVGSASGPTQAKPAPAPAAPAAPAIERVADIRARLQAHDAALRPVDGTTPPEAQVAQWFNWPNWANWSNWNNWNNWNNWLKWGKY